MCIVLSGQDGVVEQARRQLEDLVPVWAVLDYTETRCITRELLLVKVSILGPEYLEEQLQGGPSHEPRRGAEDPTTTHAAQDNAASKLEREMALAHNFEHSADSPPSHEEHTHTLPQSPFPPPTSNHQPQQLTPSEALRLKHQHLHSISVLASQFGAKLVDVSENSVIVEMSGKTSRVEAFLSLVRPFGVLESARTGIMAMPRTPIHRSIEDDDAALDEGDAVDASLLPPG
jgi:acetolactate synthase-1/3 small subunit